MLQARGLRQGLAKGREDFLDLRKVLGRYIAATVGSGSNSCPLNVRAEKVEESKESLETAFAHDGRRVLGGDLLHGLDVSLLRFDSEQDAMTHTQGLLGQLDIRWLIEL